MGNDHVGDFERWLKENLPDALDAQVELINALRRVIHEHSPFVGEPVDLVEWVPSDSVVANDYNPNEVARPEMELLRLSIMADGYTQPIVTNTEDDARVVVDGFHRNRVGKECADVRERVRGYLPVVQIRSDRLDRGDRIAATIRHNRARGRHQVVAMSDIVLELKKRNWTDNKIGKELGMEPDEVLRLAQIGGLAEAFADREFSQAWEHVGPVEDNPDVDGEDDTPVNLEWLNGMLAPSHDPGWDDRTAITSVLRGQQGARLGKVQKSRFDDGWFWYAYLQPMQKGKAETKDQSQRAVETVIGQAATGKIGSNA